MARSTPRRHRLGPVTGARGEAGDSVTGLDACAGGWVAVTLPPSATGRPSAPVPTSVAVSPTLDGLPLTGVVGIDMPLGLLGGGWREADALARRALGRRGVTVFAIPPRPVWQERDLRRGEPRVPRAHRQGTPRADVGPARQAPRGRPVPPTEEVGPRASSTRYTPSSPSPPWRAPHRRQQAHPGRPRRPQATPRPSRHHPAREAPGRSRERPPRRRRRRLVRPPHRRGPGRHPHRPRPARRRQHRNRNPLLNPRQKPHPTVRRATGFVERESARRRSFADRRYHVGGPDVQRCVSAAWICVSE